MNNEARKIKQAIKEFKVELNNMVEIMGTDATSHFKDSFVNEGFTNDSLTKWPKRKRVDRKRPGRAVLTDRGVLKRSLRYLKKGKYSVEMHTNKSLPYARRHNEGLDGMPKRQFVGYSGALNKRLREKFDKRIRRIFE